ncbi:hypothetical protein M431DRAFT_502786 [Trichoderma harzianum CBS 226.95]|uniref:Uncharacterized protein n=1 Tax=Trichoderma harzianum CBS 226.95 TaxID=983964 RepID=A0A2T4AUK2_TRIHA|nr:hypothetical protein M431DRAFT_502786 [Trichoderma harzianum CBS 226.95]PTB60648.1 hypothetical protein M431DRAFT_502786 [Trichoderma harzianum CBS 226.95]
MRANTNRLASSMGGGYHASAQDWRATTPCRFFQRGSCTKGASCPFSHNLLSRSVVTSQERGEQLEKARATNPPAESPRSAKPICRFFKTGSCIYGEKCQFRHAEEELTVQAGTNDAFEDEPKKDDDFTRTIAGAFVQFEAGARVSKIRLPSDFSAVRISGLPLNTPAISLRDMLADMGLHVSVADVHMLQMEGSCGASVRSDDAFFSKKLCAIVQPGYIWQGVKIYATPVAAPMPSSHNARRVDCKKVHISWHKAVRNVWLNFGSGDVARRVSDMFSKGVYRILNQKVTAGEATEAKPAFHPWSSSKNSVAWTVMLTEVPASAERSDILEAITQERNRPRHIEVGLPSYSADSEQATTLIRSLLTNVGPLEYFEVTLETNARRVKATARFLDEADARRAAEELDKKELPFHPKARLTVQMVYSAKFKTGTNIYDAVCPRILPQQKIWRSKNIAFRAYNSTDPLQRFRLLKIEGESAVDIVAAKADLESILAGVVMRENDTVLWDPSLKANGKLYQAIKKLEKECSIVILRDKGKSELRVFGAQECCEEAQLRLAELIRLESLSTSTRAIELQPHQFFWACHGGFRKIAARLGPEKASFDIISTPKKIVISGPLEDYDVALAIMEGRDQVAEPEEQPKPDDATQDCSVCWTDAENPIKTGCGHVYCLECFERSCKVGDVTTAAFVVSCHGNQGNCKSIIGVEDLQEHLSSAALEEVLERSFSSHIKRNPNKFRYCPTPDCGYIYRATSESRIQNCSNCLRPSCSACHESHVGMSCAEHRYLISKDYQEFRNLKEDLGIKDCPSCKTPLEKISGCNHMTCTVCNCHICWVCLKTFSSGDQVYDHMETLH